MGRNTSVSPGDHFENFIGHRISEGRYKNTSEVIHAGLWLLEDEENRITALRLAIQEGIDSGIAKKFDLQKHLEELKDRKRKNG